MTHTCAHLCTCLLILSTLNILLYKVLLISELYVQGHHDMICKRFFSCNISICSGDQFTIHFKKFFFCYLSNLPAFFTPTLHNAIRSSWDTAISEHFLWGFHVLSSQQALPLLSPPVFFYLRSCLYVQTQAFRLFAVLLWVFCFACGPGVRPVTPAASSDSVGVDISSRHGRNEVYDDRNVLLTRSPL